MGGQKRNLKVRGQNESLKESSFPFLYFFLFYGFFFLFFSFLLFEKKKCQEKAFETEGQKWEPKVRN